MKDIIIAVVVAAAGGGVATSAAEYFLNYNLVDLVKDKVLALFGKGKAEVSKIEGDIKRKL